MEKPKSEPKSKVANPSRAQVDFVSPYQLEECVQLLRQRHNYGLGAMLGPRIRVDISQLDPDTYEFKIERVGSGSITELIGDLRRWEGTYTLLVGEARISEDMYARWLVWCLMIIGIPIAVLSYYLARNARSELIRIIQRTLGVNND